MIKRLFYISVVLIILMAVIYFIASVALKPFLLKQLSQGLGRKVETKSASISFPLNLELKDLRIFNKNAEGELLTAKNLKAGVNPFSFFTKKILLNHFILINPRIKLEKNVDGSLNISDLVSPKPTQPSAAKSNKSLLVLKIEVKNGQVDFVDKTIQPLALTTKIDNLNLKITKASFPLASTAANFNTSFDLINLAGQMKGSFVSQGWVNIAQKDISADLKIKDFDVTYFKPYYKGGFSSIDNGILSFNSDISSKNNDLTAVCKLEINYLSFIQGSQAASTLFGVSVTDLVEHLKDTDGKITMNFTLRGKMDEPQKLLTQATNVVIKSTLQKLVSSQLQRLIEFGEKTTEGAGTVTGKTQEKLEDIKKVLEGIIFKPE